MGAACALNGDPLQGLGLDVNLPRESHSLL